MQTSFMHPPFGFALFYLRGIADTLFKNGALPKKVESNDIYLGAIPWVVMQLILVGIVIFFPQTVTVFLDKPVVVDLDKVQMPDVEKSVQQSDDQAMQDLLKQVARRPVRPSEAGPKMLEQPVPDAASAPRPRRPARRIRFC